MPTSQGPTLKTVEVQYASAKANAKLSAVFFLGMEKLRYHFLLATKQILPWSSKHPKCSGGEWSPVCSVPPVFPYVEYRNTIPLMVVFLYSTYGNTTIRGIVCKLLCFTCSFAQIIRMSVSVPPHYIGIELQFLNTYASSGIPYSAKFLRVQIFANSDFIFERFVEIVSRIRCMRTLHTACHKYLLKYFRERLKIREIKDPQNFSAIWYVVLLLFLML